MSTGTWGGRAPDNPWLALAAWQEVSHDAWGTWQEKGARVSSSVKVNRSAKVTPYLGVSKHRSPVDREYSEREDGTNLEPIYQLGFLVEY